MNIPLVLTLDRRFGGSKAGIRGMFHLGCKYRTKNHLKRNQNGNGEMWVDLNRKMRQGKCSAEKFQVTKIDKFCK